MGKSTTIERRERRELKHAHKHAQRHGLHIASVLRNQGVEAYEAELVKRADCELCNRVLRDG